MEWRLDRVTITGSRQATIVTIPWDSRQHLLDRLRRDKDGNEEVILAFAAVGTTRPVTLGKAGKRRTRRPASQGRQRKETEPGETKRLIHKSRIHSP
jgi:hypothetical protein